MKILTISHLFVCSLLIAAVYAKPATVETGTDTKSVGDPQENPDDLLVTPLEEAPNEDVALVPVGVVAEKVDDGEDMETANARYYPDYYFRPVYTYRRVQSNRRRVYTPRRRVHNYDSGDRFPTVT